MREDEARGEASHSRQEAARSESQVLGLRLSEALVCRLLSSRWSEVQSLRFSVQLAVSFAESLDGSLEQHARSFAIARAWKQPAEREQPRPRESARGEECALAHSHPRTAWSEAVEEWQPEQEPRWPEQESESGVRQARDGGAPAASHPESEQ